MSETQVLIRLEKQTLEEVDKTFPAEGFRTRNELFRFLIRRFLEENKRKKLADRLDRLTAEGIRNEDIVKMVKEWRAGKAKR